jgi:hypothetical protein
MGGISTPSVTRPIRPCDPLERGRRISCIAAHLWHKLSEADLVRFASGMFSKEQMFERFANAALRAVASDTGSDFAEVAAANDATRLLDQVVAREGKRVLSAGQGRAAQALIDDFALG